MTGNCLMEITVTVYIKRLRELITLHSNLNSCSGCSLYRSEKNDGTSFIICNYSFIS